MGTDGQDTIFKSIINICLKKPKITFTVIVLLVFVFFGGLIFFSSRIYLNPVENQTSKQSKSNNQSIPQGQDPSVEGASTQQYGPQDQPASVSPSQNISEAVSTPAPASSSTTSPTATPTPTNSPASTAVPTTTNTPTPAPTETSTVAPTATPEISPSQSPTLSPIPSE